MRSTELRIGNLVESNGETISVSGFILYKLSVSENIGDPLKIKPIPTTEDWFRKLPDDEWEFIGFGTRLIVQHIKFKSIKIEYCHNQFAFYFNDELINFKVYMHDAQNLYYALTGTELILK